MKQRIARNGYYIVDLSKDGIHKKIPIHKIVASLFVYNDDPEHKIFINHKDENKLNNLPENLEWCTPEYNIKYGTRNKKSSETMKEKIRNGEISVVLPCAKKSVVQLSLDGTYIRTWDGIIDAVQEGYNEVCISSCCSKKYANKTHKGYKWMYLSDYQKLQI